MLRIFCHGIPFFPIQKINLFSHENVQYDKPCCTDDNMDGECMDQSCAWKQPCEYVVATTMTYHDLVTLTAMNTTRTIVITINTASTCTATTIIITTTEYLFTSTMSSCKTWPSMTLKIMIWQPPWPLQGKFISINHDQNKKESYVVNSSHQKNGRCVLSAWLRNGHVHAGFRGKRIIKMAPKS